MAKRLLVVLLLSVLTLTGLGTSSSASAHTAERAARRCLPGSGAASGTCFTFLSSRKHSVAVESVPLVNHSHKVVTLHCDFTRTVSRSVTWGASLTTTAKATLFKVVEASVSATVSRTVSQTAQQATRAGGSVTLRPGQSVTCLRTYGWVVTRVRKVYWTSNDQIHIETVIKSKVPSHLGVTVVD